VRCAATLPDRGNFFRKHDEYRIDFLIFRLHEVFNTSVDKLVEKGASHKANYTILSILERFALFLCISTAEFRLPIGAFDFYT
jgi:hypothetical protein